MSATDREYYERGWPKAFAAGYEAAVADRAEIFRLARHIADDAPKRRGAYVHRAGVRWDLIHALRAALARLGA